MSIKINYSIQYDGKLICQRNREIITKYHYSKSYRSLQQVHVFSLIFNDVKVGVAVFGKTMSRHNNQCNVLELRKLSLINDTPKNTESYFISKCLKWIRTNDKNIDNIISFADPNYKHKGIIYKASNFNFVGNEKAGNPRVVKYKRKTIHIRQVYQKKDGKYTKNALQIQNLIKTKKAKIVNVKPKLKFEFKLRRNL